MVQSFWFGRAWRVIDAVAWPGPRTLLQGLWIVAALVVLAAALDMLRVRVLPRRAFGPWGRAVVQLWLIASCLSFLALMTMESLVWFSRPAMAALPVARWARVGPARHTVFRYVVWLAGGLPFLAAVYGATVGRLRYRVITVEVPITDLPPHLDGLRIVHGFSLHANTHVPAHRREQLERLIRYMARGAVSLERLTQDAHGALVFTFTHPWSDETTGIRLSPMELLEKLAALVPLPCVYLVRYGGCVAPHRSLRGAIIPTLRQQGLEDEETDTVSPRWSWARLLKRVFALAMVRCPFCQRGALRVIAAITQGEVIRTILRQR